MVIGVTFFNRVTYCIDLQFQVIEIKIVFGMKMYECVFLSIQYIIMYSLVLLDQYYINYHPRSK